jgi:TctA family transporter
MLIAFLAVGMQPGPAMMTTQLNLMFAVIWALAIANIIGGAMCLALTRPMAMMAFWPFHSVVPLIMVLCFLGAFSATFEMADILMLLIFSVIGFFMKLLGWPRAPVILGGVLGPIMEKYLWLSTATYGVEWLIRPTVLLLFALIIFTSVVGPMWQRRQRKKEKALEKSLAAVAAEAEGKGKGESNP